MFCQFLWKGIALKKPFTFSPAPKPHLPKAFANFSGNFSLLQTISLGWRTMSSGMFAPNPFQLLWLTISPDKPQSLSPSSTLKRSNSSLRERFVSYMHALAILRIVTMFSSLSARFSKDDSRSRDFTIASRHVPPYLKEALPVIDPLHLLLRWTLIVFILFWSRTMMN